ncbi:MAG: hypothetical protein P8Y00_10395 [Deltaproteobacteria bacterium]
MVFVDEGSDGMVLNLEKRVRGLLVYIRHLCTCFVGFSTLFVQGFGGKTLQFGLDKFFLYGYGGVFEYDSLFRLE